MSEYIEREDWKLPHTEDIFVVATFDQIPSIQVDGMEKDKLIWVPSTFDKFTVKDTYKALRGSREYPNWQGLVWFKMHIPKQSLITWLAFHHRLKNKSRLIQRGVEVSPTCILCNQCLEDDNNL